MLLRCFDTGEANRLMAEVHSGDCGAHMNGFMLSRKILRMGYYWFTMEHDCAKYVRACQQCQFYADKSKAPSVPLNNMTTSNLEIKILGFPWSDRVRREHLYKGGM